ALFCTAAYNTAFPAMHRGVTVATTSPPSSGGSVSPELTCTCAVASVVPSPCTVPATVKVPRPAYWVGSSSSQVTGSISREPSLYCTVTSSGRSGGSPTTVRSCTGSIVLI